MATSEEVQGIIKDMQKDFGSEKANIGSDEQPVERIPTKSLELDYASNGGVPIGRFTRFYGGPSSGKSVKCWHVVSEAQKMGMVCAYYNAEKQFTYDFAQKQGVDTDNLIVVQGSIIEDIGEIIESNLDRVDVHIIDSCSSCVSRTELADGLNEREYIGIRPRKWNQQFAFIKERFDKDRNVMIYVDQIRNKFSPGGMTSTGPPGGNMMEHDSSLTVEFKKGKWLWYNADGNLTDTRNTKQKTFSSLGEADGIEIQAQVVKSRVCRPFRRAMMKFDLNKLEFDTTDELVKAAKYFDLVEVSKGWVKIKGTDKSLRSSELKTIIENDQEFAELIRTTALEN